MKLKWIFLLLLLSLTVFLKSCSSDCCCEDFDSHTFSVGFILPYFDIAICRAGEPIVSFPYNTFLAVGINLFFGSIILLFLFKGGLAKWNKSLSRLAFSLFINIAIFDLSLFRNDYKFAEWIYIGYVYTPILCITRMFGQMGSGNPIEFNLLSRIYFVMVVIVVYFIIVVWEAIWGMARRTISGRAQ